MDTTPLLKWLGLPPGLWPPDDRTLLGLPAGGPVDEATAELNALARMEQLRPHQLVHPELVTEGMNRLAQALIAVTSLPAVSLPTAPPAAARAPGPPAPVAPEAAVAVVLEAEMVEASAPVSVRPRSPVPAGPTIVLLDDLPPPVLADAHPPPGLDRLTADRRKAYRELVFLRKLRRIWGRLAAIAGVPSENVRSAETVYHLLQTSRELRPLIRANPGAATILDGDGRAVAAVFRQPHAARVLRDLTPAQRTRLAADWAAGMTVIDAGYGALRASLRNSVPRNRLRVALGVVRQFLGSNPEWVLVVLTAVLVMMAFGKVWVRGPSAD